MAEALVQVRDVHKVYQRGSERIDVLAGLSLDVEWIALSFVRSRNDVADLKRRISQRHKSVRVIAKAMPGTPSRHLFAEETRQSMFPGFSKSKLASFQPYPAWQLVQRGQLPDSAMQRRSCRLRCSSS